MKYIMIGIGSLIAISLTPLAFIYSGLYDVSAASPHTRIEVWAFNTMKNRAIQRQAAPTSQPQDFDSSQMRTGLVHYQEMCVTCHGAPGVRPSEIAQGLNPQPPDFSKNKSAYKPYQIHWIIQNGLRMTGMPGFGATHDADTLWAMVAALERLPDMSADEYGAALRQEQGAGHVHGEETNQHAEPGQPSSHHPEQRQSESDTSPSERQTVGTPNAVTSPGSPNTNPHAHASHPHTSGGAEHPH